MKNIYTSLLFVLLMTGCGDTVTLQTPLKGSLAGVVATYDKNYNMLSAENANITVEGASIPITVKADAGGHFIINDLQTGSYNLKFSKEGFSTYKIPGYAFVGGDSPAALSAALIQLPEVQVSDIDVDISKWSNWHLLSGYVSIVPANATYYTYIRYYLSTSPKVSATNYLNTGTFSAVFTSGLASLYLSIDVSKYPVGTEIYFVLHPCTETSQSYLDVATGNQVYTSITPEASPVFHFTTR